MPITARKLGRITIWPASAIIQIIHAVALDTINVGSWTLSLVSKLRWQCYLRADQQLRLDLTPRLAEICLAGDVAYARVVIKKYQSSINVALFLDIVLKCSDTDENNNRNEAIEVAIRGYRDSISTDAANEIVIQACELQSVATMPIFSEFFYRLKPETIETILVHNCELQPRMCIGFIKRSTWFISRFEKRAMMTPRSLAISLRLSSQCEPEKAAEILSILNNHYCMLPGVRCNRGCVCACWSRKQLLLDCGIHGQIDVVRAILKGEPQRAGRFLDQGISGNSPGVVMVVFEEYRDMLEPKDIVEAMDWAVYCLRSYIVDMLMSLFPNEISQTEYIGIFNKYCESGRHYSVELMLDKCRLQFEHGFTFDPDRVKGWKKIVRLLDAAYRDQLRVQFPDWFE